MAAPPVFDLKIVAIASTVSEIAATDLDATIATVQAIATASRECTTVVEAMSQ
jgi:hypothetical protein